MTRSLLRRRAGLAAFAAAAAAAAAIAHAQAQTAQTALPPRYRVEVIVFTDGNFNPSEELFEQTAPALSVSDVRVFDDAWLRAQEENAELARRLAGGETNARPVPPQGRQPSTEIPGLSPLDAQAPPLTAPVEPPFRLLAPEELELTPQYRRLANSNRWRPVLHSGWVQNVVEENRTEPVRLTALGVHNPAGTISLYRNNYMHLRLDVVYQDTFRRSFGDRGAGDGGAGGGAGVAGAADGGAVGSFGDRSSGLYSLEPFELTPRYRLDQNRQTRSGVLQHFDHPAFGVLVKVTEIPRATTSPGARQRPEP
jgi:hypothetical protein